MGRGGNNRVRINQFYDRKETIETKEARLERLNTSKLALLAEYAWWNKEKDLSLTPREDGLWDLTRTQGGSVRMSKDELEELYIALMSLFTVKRYTKKREAGEVKRPQYLAGGRPKVKGVTE